MSVYEKDVTKLWIILITTIILSIVVVGYSYSYNVDSINEKDLELMIVYNTGRNACYINSDTNSEVECKFTIMGYNNTNKDLNYKLVAKNSKNNTINSKLVEITLINEKNDKEISHFKGSDIQVNNIIKETTVLKNSKVFDEYLLKISINKDELISDVNGNYLVNFDVIYN